MSVDSVVQDPATEIHKHTGRAGDSHGLMGTTAPPDPNVNPGYQRGGESYARATKESPSTLGTGAGLDLPAPNAAQGQASVDVQDRGPSTSGLRDRKKVAVPPLWTQAAKEPSSPVRPHHPIPGAPSGQGTPDAQVHMDGSVLAAVPGDGVSADQSVAASASGRAALGSTNSPPHHTFPSAPSGQLRPAAQDMEGTNLATTRGNVMSVDPSGALIASAAANGGMDPPAHHPFPAAASGQRTTAVRYMDDTSLATAHGDGTTTDPSGARTVSAAALRSTDSVGHQPIPAATSGQRTPDARNVDGIDLAPVHGAGAGMDRSGARRASAAAVGGAAGLATTGLGVSKDSLPSPLLSSAGQSATAAGDTKVVWTRARADHAPSGRPAVEAMTAPQSSATAGKSKPKKSKSRKASTKKRAAAAAAVAGAGAATAAVVLSAQSSDEEEEMVYGTLRDWETAQPADKQLSHRTSAAQQADTADSIQKSQARPLATHEPDMDPHQQLQQQPDSSLHQAFAGQLSSDTSIIARIASSPDDNSSAAVPIALVASPIATAAAASVSGTPPEAASGSLHGEDGLAVPNADAGADSDMDFSEASPLSMSDGYASRSPSWPPSSPLADDGSDMLMFGAGGMQMTTDGGEVEQQGEEGSGAARQLQDNAGRTSTSQEGELAHGGHVMDVLSRLLSMQEKHCSLDDSNGGPLPQSSSMADFELRQSIPAVVGGYHPLVWTPKVGLQAALETAKSPAQRLELLRASSGSGPTGSTRDGGVSLSTMQPSVKEAVLQNTLSALTTPGPEQNAAAVRVFLLAANYRSRMDLWHSGCGPALLPLLSRGSGCQKEAAAAVANLSCMAQLGGLLYEAGALSPLMTIATGKHAPPGGEAGMEEGRDEATRMYACQALTNIVCNQRECRNSIAARPGLVSLLATVARTNKALPGGQPTQLQIASLAVLSNLSVSPECREVVIAQGGVEAAVEVIRGSCDGADAPLAQRFGSLMAALLLLWNVAPLPGAMAAVSRSDGATLLVSLLTPQNCSLEFESKEGRWVRQAAVGTLGKLSLEAAGGAAVDAAGGIAAISRVMVAEAAQMEQQLQRTSGGWSEDSASTRCHAPPPPPPPLPPLHRAGGAVCSPSNILKPYAIACSSPSFSISSCHSCLLWKAAWHMSASHSLPSTKTLHHENRALSIPPICLPHKGEA